MGIKFISRKLENNISTDTVTTLGQRSAIGYIAYEQNFTCQIGPPTYIKLIGFDLVFFLFYETRASQTFAL